MTETKEAAKARHPAARRPKFRLADWSTYTDDGGVVRFKNPTLENLAQRIEAELGLDIDRDEMDERIDR